MSDGIGHPHGGEATTFKYGREGVEEDAALREELRKDAQQPKEAQAKVSGRQNHILTLAIQEGNVDKVRECLGRRYDVTTFLDFDQPSCFFPLAIQQGNPSIVQLLLDAGADIETYVAAQGATALHYAAQAGHEEIVKTLVANGADVNAWTFAGWTALELGTREGNSDSRRYYHTWIMDWQAQEYLKTEFGPQDDIDDILVLCSDRTFCANVACTTLRSFLLRCGGSSQLVDGIVSGLLSFTRAISNTTDQQLHLVIKDVDLWIELRTSWQESKEAHLIRVQARTQTLEVIGLVESILTTLCCALRPPSAEITWSDAHFKSLSDHASQIILKPLEKVSNCGCWTALFNRKVVVQRTIDRHNDVLHSPPLSLGRMLKAPLSWLSALAGADSPIHLDGSLQDAGGLCLSGPYSLLIPSELHRSDSGHGILIWHLLTVERIAGGEPRSRHHLLDAFRKWSKDAAWYKTERLEDLRGMKYHLLGWTPEARITLGAPDQIYRIRRTSAKTVGFRPVEPTINTGLSIGSAGSGATIGMSFKIGAQERSIHMDKERNLKEWLLSSQKQQAPLWNPEHAQGWVVPVATVVLHMTIAILRNLPNQQGDYRELPEELTELYHAPDASWRLPLRVLGERLGARLDCLNLDMTIGMVVKDLLTMLGQMYLTNSPLGLSRRFLGFEISDLLHRPPNFRIRQDDVSLHFISLGNLGGWHKLLPEMSAVLFFKDIKDPIVSVAPSKTKVPMQSLTKGCNHLAMMASSLLVLLSKYDDSDRSNGQLADDAYWQCEYLFGHQHSLNTPRQNCDRLQVVAGRPHPAGVPIPVLQDNPQAAVIFRANTGLLERASGNIYN
ncbi:hypothetical protein H2200_006056 [Cladophialophora chaetospira]|uniref:Uncharacterized protein n=1 Tax=Cladophialophora chaetospira TaxID=386627 RepID=A0AA38XAC2_9EURO|nr:hypothetical protein H2200_006056 [Cladophialophora chaetospira]